jgi:hypothetical protein
MHYVLNLLTIKGLYMFRALLAHPQEMLHKRHLVYACSELTQHARNIPSTVCVAASEDEQLMLETCRQALNS